MNFIQFFRNAEEVARLNSQIEEQRSRMESAECASRRVRELLSEVNVRLYNLCEKFQVRKGAIITA